MSRRRRQQPDSLELLLDTMCNTFGGIIMIALLIALLSRDASSETTVNQRTETVRRELTAAQTQTTEAQQLQQRLKQSADPSADATLELLTQRDHLREQIDSATQTIRSNTTALAAIPAPADPTELQRLLTQHQTKTNELHTIEQQLARVTEAHQRQLRLPRERITGKKTFYFIARFGKIYPVHFLREGRRELNLQTLDWSRTADGESPLPRREAGLDLATGLPNLARLINEIPTETYSIHFLVYEDSFPTFLTARQIPLARNYDVGWEFLPTDKPINFSSRGEAPPAL